MTSNARVVEDPRSRTPLLRLVGLAISIYVFLLMACIFSIFLEYAGMALSFWDESGALHARAQAAAELEYLQDFGHAASALTQQASWLVKWFYLVLWTYSPLGGVAWLARVAIPGEYLAGIEHYIAAADYSVQVVALRGAISTLTLPAFALIGLVAMMDGLVQRELRKYGGGHESALVYHWAHRHIRPLLVTPWIIYLSVPFSIHPNWVFVPCMAAAAIAINVATAKFKKVL